MIKEAEDDLSTRENRYHFQNPLSSYEESNKNYPTYHVLQQWGYYLLINCYLFLSGRDQIWKPHTYARAGRTKLNI